MSDFKEFVTPSGSPEKPIFTAHVLENGEIELVETGKENFQEYIDSFKDSCDINIILTKCANGDISALSRVQGFYADVSSMPKNNAELLQQVIDGQRNFELLPIEIKQQFNCDFNQWFATMDQPEWFEKMKMPEKVVKEEVKEVKSE